MYVYTEWFGGRELLVGVFSCSNSVCEHAPMRACILGSMAHTAATTMSIGE